MSMAKLWSLSSSRYPTIPSSLIGPIDLSYKAELLHRISIDLDMILEHDLGTWSEPFLDECDLPDALL